MDYVDEKIRELVMVSDILEKESLRVFVIAVLLGWEDIMRVAAHATLGVPLRNLGWCQELELLSAGDHHKLFQWRFACYDAVKDFLLYSQNLRRSSVDGEKEFRKSVVATLRQKLETSRCPRSSALIDDKTKATLLREAPGSLSTAFLKKLAEEIDQAWLEVRDYPRRKLCPDLG